MEDEKSLKACALIGEFTDPVEYEIDNFLSDGVVASSVVVSSILFAGDQLLWVEQLAVGTGAYFICKRGIQVSVNFAAVLTHRQR